MRRLTDLHAEATRYRAAAAAGERAFADGLRVGDGVRRAVRQGARERPDDADCAALEDAAERVAVALAMVADLPEIGALNDALPRDPALAAELACRVFAGLEREASPPAHGYRAHAVRERRRGGESLPAPEALAARLAELARRGISAARRVASEGAPPVAGSSPALDATPAVPDPVVLSPSLAASGSELALRVALDALPAPVLRHAGTGDLWVFSPAPLAPAEVAWLSDADDEWWAASPIPYREYGERLLAALASHGIAAAVEPA
jgi:hypothetical protein